MRKTSKNILNWFLVVMLVVGFGEVSGKGMEILALTISPSGNVSICSGASQTISILGAATTATFQWKKDDVVIVGATSSTYPATVAATYTCVVTEGTVVTTVGSVVLTIKPLPSVTVSASDNNICSGFSSELTANGAISYVWSPSTALSSTTTNPVTANPTATTAYTVTGTGSNGCKNTASTTITVNPNPLAPAITATPTTICSRGSIAFSTPAIAGQTFSWDFGDGTTDGAGTIVNHTYNLASTGNGSQNFTVTLTTTIGSTGCKSTRTQVVTVKQLPDAALTDYQTPPKPFTICTGSVFTSIQVTNTSTTSTTNNSYSISWGDASPNFTSTSWPVNSITEHTYSNLGFFTFSLTVVGQNGCQNSKNYTAYKGSNPQVPFTNPGSSVGVCVPFTYSIPTLSNTNPPGTTYTISTNDGIPDVVLQNPLPTSFQHTFSNSSCGASGGNTPNTYYIKIRAQNPCGFSDLRIEPITTNIEPISQIFLTPGTIICNNQTVSLTDTSNNGIEVDNFGVCSYVSPNNWIIQPLTGWSLTAGSNLGNNPPNTNPATWGSNVLQVLFNTPGTYQVYNLVKNVCGTDTSKKTICVNPTPTASFTLTPNPINGCSPLLVNALGSTNTPTCGVNAFNWVVSYTPTNGCTPSTSDYSYVDGTSSTSRNPHFNFISPGVYTISLQTIAPDARCSSAVVIQTVTVKSKPVVSINLSNSTICVNQSISPTNTSTCYIDPSTTYSWSFPNGTPTTSTSSNPGAITYNNSGTNNITLNVTNICGTTPASSSVIVNPLPSITGTASVCVSATTQLTGSPSAATTNAWTSSNTSVATVNSSGLVTGIAAGNVDIIYTNSDGCSKKITITVNPLPSITGTATICVNATTQLTGSPSAATTNAWTTSNSAVATVSSTGLVTGIGAGTSEITYTNTNGCSKKITITVIPLPTISGNTTICLNNNSQLTGSGTASSTIPWASSNVNVATVSITGLVTALTVGTTDITYTDNIGCSKTTTITVKALPIITGSSSICVGSVVTFTANVSPAIVSPWASLNTSVATITSAGVVTGLLTGTSTITYTDQFGCKANFSVSVSSSPTATISYPSAVCTNQTNQNVTLTGVSGGTFSLSPIGTTGLTLNTTTGALNPSTSTPGTYTVNYNLPAGNGCDAVNVDTSITITTTPIAPVVTSPVVYCQNIAASALTATASGSNTLLFYNASTGGTGLTSLIPSTASVGSITYYASQVTTNGCEGPRTPVTVTVNPLPTITNNSPICLGSNLTLISSPTAATSNPWVSATTSVATVNNTGVVTAVSSGTSIITYTNTNSCQTTVTFTVNPLPTITGNTTICLNNRSQLTGSGTAAAINAWTSSSPSVATISVSGLVTTVSLGTTTITYTDNNGCVKTANVIVKPLPIITGSSSICVGSNVTFTATTNPSTITPWSSSNTSVVSISSSGAVVGVAAGTTTITYTDEFGCQATLLVTVSSSPTATISYPSAVCTNQTNQNVTQTGNSGGTFSSTPGLTINTTTGAVNPFSSTPGTYNVNYNLPAGNGCAAVNVNTSITITANPITPTIQNVNPLCSGNTLNLSASTTSAGTPTWSWNGPSSFTSTLQNPSITNATTAATGTYNVTVTISGCTSPAGTINVVVNQTPATPTASSNTPVCTGNALTLAASTSTPSVTWSWSGPSSFTSTSQNPPVSATATTAMSGTYNVTATATYITTTTLNCPSAQTATFVVVNPTPAIGISTFTNPTNCSSPTGTIILNGLTASTSYTVNYTNSAGAQTATIISSSTGVITIPSLLAGTYSNVYVVSTSGCTSNNVGPFSLVDPSPPATPVISNVNPLCSGNTLNLSASTTSTGTQTWSWNGPNSFTSSLQNPSIINTTTAATGPYNVTVTISGCTSPVGTINVVVNQTPAIPTASSNTPVCTGNALSLTASTSSTIPVTWSWTGQSSFTSSTQNPQVNANATTAMAGEYNVIATATYPTSTTTLNCPSATASTIVVVNPTPAIGISTFTNPTNCSSPTGTIILNGLTVSTSYTVHYTNSAGAQTATISSNSSGVITIPSLLAGTYSNVYVVLTNCPSSPVGPFDLVDPTPPPAPSATNNSAICDGESLQLNASTTEPGTPTWNWTGPSAFTSTLQNPQITSATLINAGPYNVTVTINSCTSSPATTTVIVNPRPLAPGVTSQVIYCQNVVPVPLTATALSGHRLKWYTSLTGTTGSATAPTPSTSTVGTVSYFVSQTTPENCEGPREQIDVIVNPTPVVSNQSQTRCSGASFLISPSGTSSVPSNTLYSWGLPVVTGGLTGGATGTSQSNITGTLFNPTDFVQTATYTVTSISGSCPGNTFTVVISVNPAPRVEFSLTDQSICSGVISQAVTLTSPTPGAVIPWTSTQPTGINGVTLLGSGTIPAQTLINTTPDPITITYTATASTTGTSACPGTSTPYQIVVTPTPVIPNTTETFCSGGSFNVEPANNTNTIVPTGTTYTWTVSTNSNITGQAGQTIAQTSIAATLTNISNVPQTIVYTVKPKSGIADFCVGETFTITVTVNPKPVIPTLTKTICSGTGFLLTPTNGDPNPNTIVPNATEYNWAAPTLPVGMSGAASGTNESTISGTLFNTTFAPITITYLVTPTSGAAGSCPGLPFNVEITVNPLASISNNPLSQSVCNDNTTTSVNWSSFTAGSTYSWTLVSSGNVTGYIPAGNGPTLGTMTLSNTGIAQDSVVYAVSSTASACAGPATNYTIYVNPDAKANYTYPYDTACWPYAIVINNTSPLSLGNINIPNSSYNWYTINQLGTETLIGSGSLFPGYSILGPSDSIKIKLEAISAFGCKNDSLKHTFFTKPKPTALFSISNRDNCGPLTTSFVNLTNIRDTFRYQWDFGNGQTSTATNPSPVTYVSNPRFFDTTYYITMRAFNECDTTSHLDSVIVRADPKARFSVTSSSGCSPFTVEITNSSLGNPHTYYWDFGDGTPVLTTTTVGTLSHTYYTGVVDTFDLMLVAENNCGRDTQKIKIRVAPNVIIPGVSVTATELYGCVSHSVNFINTSTGATNFIWDFGDGTPLQTTNFFQTIVNHTFDTAGTFNININMTNGCSDTSINTSITVYPRPTAAFTTNQTVYCLGDTTRFINNSINATNYTWSLGNGVFNTNVQPNYLYLNPGVYNIQLEAQQSNPTGLVCFDTITRSITILSKPDTAIITNIRPANCSPYLMTASVPGYTTESITWYVYDTTLPVYPVVIANPTLNYTFNNSGRFKVVMVIENASGCKDSSFRFLNVYAKPVAGFTPLNLATCSLDTTVSYINNTTANIYTPLTYRWYVDGIQRATSGNFTYRYTALPSDILPRIFNTKLVATNSVGCADSTTGTLQMNPTAKSIFTLNNPQACIPFVAAINNSSTYASNYQWYLNGVLVSTGENPIINITTANTSYTVTLIVSNIYACRPDTSRFTFRTRVMPIAAFSFNDTLGCRGELAVITTNTSQYANAYTWEWGDASANSTITNPTHLFSSVGTYNTLLTASDGVCTDTVSHSVVVSQKPTANFIANNVKICDTSGVRFINLTANATSFIWSVSNGFTTTETSPTIILNPSPTPYSITLLAINAEGCRDSLTRANYIKVYALPQGDFTITPSPTIYIPNYTFVFLNLTPDYPIYKYNWSLGDGSFAITRDVVSHLYNDTGNYEVRLTILDTTTSCVDTVIKFARIAGYPGYLYVPNAFYANSTQLNFKYFKPLGKGLADYELLIFDSWGKLLFRTTKLDYAGSPVDGWDGTYKGSPMPQDAYAWKIKARFRNGRVWEGMNYDQSQEKQPAHSFGTLTLFR